MTEFPQIMNRSCSGATNLVFNVRPLVFSELQSKTDMIVALTIYILIYRCILLVQTRSTFSSQNNAHVYVLQVKGIGKLMIVYGRRQYHNPSRRAPTVEFPERLNTYWPKALHRIRQQGWSESSWLGPPVRFNVLKPHSIKLDKQ